MTTMPRDHGECRYERKFVIAHLTRHEVESFVRFHPAMFSEIYRQRYVNNIYFDTNQMSNYHDNIDGKRRRIKIRIRWYDALFGIVKNPVLEFKIKYGFLGRKESFPLPPFELNDSFNARTVAEVIERSDLPEIRKLQWRSSCATLVNSYKRRYFESADRNCRITMDTDQTFYAVNHHHNLFLHRLTDDQQVILELKYHRDMDGQAEKIAAHFPFRLSRSSKYVTGLQKLYPW